MSVSAMGREHGPDASAPSSGRGLTWLAEQYRRLPRVLRWVALAALVLAFYGACNTTTWAWAREASRDADLLQLELDKAARRPMVDRSVREVVLAQGPIRLPTSEAEGIQRLGDAANFVKNSHREVEKWRYQARPASRLQGTTLAGVIPGGRKASKVAADIEFDAPTEVAAAVVAELESHPDIDSISSMSMARIENTKLVHVRMTIEGWVAGADERRRPS